MKGKKKQKKQGALSNVTPITWEHEKLRNSVKYIPKEFEIILGKPDGLAEWNDKDKETAKAKFLYTESSKRFASENTVILQGRVGTGKTTIMQHLKQQIEDGVHDEFRYAVEIGLTKFLHKISALHSEMLNTIFDARNIQFDLEVFIYTEVMIELAKKNEKIPWAVSRFLKTKGLQHRNLFDRAIDELASLDPKVNDTFAGINLITNMVRSVKTQDYLIAVKELHEFLKGKNVVVLIDTIDEYDVRVNTQVIILKALVNCAYDFYNFYHNHHIMLKVALPSEIYNEVCDRLPAKRLWNYTTIRWPYRDLVKMIAIKIHYVCVHNESYQQLFPFVTYYETKQFYTDFELAKSFLNKFLPAKCITDTAVELDTIAYIIRHSQKRPREVLILFNSLFYAMAEEYKQANYFYIHPEKIKEKIHATENDMILSVLSMYALGQDEKESLSNQCKKTLKNMKFIFKGSELRRRAKAVSYNYIAKDFIRILLESGLIGRVCDKKIIQPGHVHFQNSEPLQLIRAEFEYQLKYNSVDFDINDEYVLHPMCYEFFECVFDENSMVFPNDLDDETDWIESTIMLRDVI